MTVDSHSHTASVTHCHPLSLTATHCHPLSSTVTLPSLHPPCTLRTLPAPFTLSSHPLHTLFALSLHSLCTLFTLSSQSLHNLFTLSSHSLPGTPWHLLAPTSLVCDPQLYFLHFYISPVTSLSYLSRCGDDRCCQKPTCSNLVFSPTFQAVDLLRSNFFSSTLAARRRRALRAIVT